MIFHDHKVPTRALEGIEGEAIRCLTLGGATDHGYVDLDALLRKLDIELSVRSDAHMEGAEAYSRVNPNRIFCRRSISKGLRTNDPHARFIIAHELGHQFLHRGSSPKPRMVDGNRTLNFIPPEESAENQADTFARALLLPRLLLSKHTDDELVLIAAVPLEQVRLRRREAMPRKRPDVARRLAWENLERIAGEDSAEYRKCGRWRVRWSEYGMETECGWTIDRWGRATATFAKE